MPKAIHREEILELVREHLEAGGAPIAAFDADGTLWSSDIGEAAFGAGRALIDDATLLGPVQDFGKRWDLDLAGDPDQVWEKISSFALGDGLGDGLAEVSDELLVDLYALEAWIFAGRQEQELIDHGERLFNDGLAEAIFDQVQLLITELRALEVRVVVLSGSLRGVLLPGTRRLGVPDEDVFGTEPHRTDDGRYLAQAVTMFGAEKGARLDELSNGREIVAAFGDAPSGNDRDIMNRAQLAVVMNPRGKHRDYARENGMRAWWLR